MNYKLNYDTRTGQVIGIIRDNACIPLCEDNSDYQDFLKWNKVQKTPLDLNSTIEVVKPVDPMITYKEDWAKSMTTTQKLAVIAKVLKLEG